MKVSSTNIDTIDYTPEGLKVTFNSGRTYLYPNAPESVYEQLVEEAWKTDGSVGKLFNELVRKAGFAGVEVDA